MNSVSIRKMVVFSLALIVLAMAGIGVLGFIKLGSIEAEANGVEHDTLPGLFEIGVIKTAIREGRELTDQYMNATGPEAAALRSSISDSRRSLAESLARYEQTVTADADRKSYQEFRAALATYQAGEDARIQAASAPDVGGAANAIASRDAFRAIMEHAQALSLNNKEWGIARARNVRDEIADLQSTFLIAFGAAMVLALACSIHLIRVITRPLGKLADAMDVMRQGDFTQRIEIERNDEFGDLGEGFNRMADEIMALVGQVQKSGIRISSSMTEIAATAKQQQATASEVAASTTQIGATSREISATSKELARTMNEVASVADNAANLASSGQAGLAHMEHVMVQVMEAAGVINAKLATLNEKASNINQVVTTITKVADQTNLLSLNAAIEAEKAGEYGRGFSVVSSEIRRLADQTAVATLDIEEMVKEIQLAVSAGVMGMDKFSEEVRRGMQEVQQVGGKLTDVIEQVQTLAPRFDVVNDGMEAQALGAEQISEALLQLTDTTRQTVEALHQSNQAIEHLSQVSAGLHESVARFKLAS